MSAPIFRYPRGMRRRSLSILVLAFGCGGGQGDTPTPTASSGGAAGASAGAAGATAKAGSGGAAKGGAGGALGKAGSGGAPSGGTSGGSAKAGAGGMSSLAGASGAAGSAVCKKTTCAGAGADCGLVPDGCGGLLTCGGCTGGFVCGATATNKCGLLTTRVDPQYLAVNKSPTSNNTCCRFFYEDPTSITGAGFDEIRDQLFVYGSSMKQDTQNPSRRLALQMAIPYLESSEAQEDEILKRLFDNAVAKSFPIVIKLDGISWWENRPDLWNFWDPSDPGGYHPENSGNVEWYDWAPSAATKIAWRNWGSLLRVRPHPNLASPVVLAEKHKELTRLVRKIAAFYRALPLAQRALLAGVVLDNELSIGVNHFYYADGNSYVGKPDPPPATPTVPIGYAAVKGYGLATSGPLTPALLDQAVRIHAAWLADTARTAGLLEGVDLGEKLYVHGFADQGATSQFQYGDVVSPSASPGWSFYAHAYDPSKANGLLGAVSGPGGNALPWGAVEWLYTGGLGGSESDQWANAMRNTLSYRNDRIVIVQNWEGINGDRALPQPKLDALAAVALEPATCLVEAPITEEATLSGGVVTLRWHVGADTGATFLNVSSSPTQVDGGAFAKVDVANDAVTGATEKTLSGLAPGTYWFKVIADGCAPTARMLSETRSFVVP